MPLDNAQFISELSILDPPGTDPLNQGDDHIRTVKRATQQSFPNVNAAVPQTAAQMGQMAIKNEANTFTQVNTFQQQPVFQNDILLDSGSTTAITFDKAGVRQWRINYSGTTDDFDIRRYIGGVLQDAPLEITKSTGVVNFLRGINVDAASTFQSTIRTLDGNAVAPPYSFQADTGMGMFRGGAGLLGFATQGVERMTLVSSATIMFQQLRMNAGSAGTPSHSFSDNVNMGMYRVANNILGFATEGTERLRIQLNSFIPRDNIHAVDGTVGGPAYSFVNEQNTGMFTSVANTLQFATGGVQRMYLDGNGVNSNNAVITNPGSAANPGFRFHTDLTTGVYRAAASTLGFSAGGVSVATMSTALFMGSGFRVLSDPMSVSAPSFSFTNDFDTGMYRSGENQLAFATAGVERFRINADGRMIMTSANTLEIRTPATSTASSVQLRPGGVLFWEMASGTISNRVWALVRYNDAGSFLGLPIQVSRLDGVITLAELPTTNPGGSGRLWKSGGFVAVT